MINPKIPAPTATYTLLFSSFAFSPNIRLREVPSKVETNLNSNSSFPGRDKMVAFLALVISPNPLELAGITNLFSKNIF